MFAISIYIAAIVAANLSVASFGPAVTPINAFFLIGLDLSLRDHLHERWRGNQLALRMGGLLLAAGAISFALNPASGRIAIASVIAFVVSNAIDAMVYQLLIKRGYLARSNGSNAAGALVDSALFPTIAFGSVMPAIVVAQFAAKLVGGFFWSIGIKLVSRKTA
jgi:hypothetical protein